jgi:heterodisulfide reductase subunit C
MQAQNTPETAPSLNDLVVSLAHVDVRSCYQCGKCTAGCPLSQEMDIKPNQILRLLQAGRAGYEKEILSSQTIWLCLACDTCSSRCPQEIPLSAVMDALRQESLRQKLVHPKAKHILQFHEAFLNEIRRDGKLNELELTLDYKMKSMALFQDVQNAPSMFLKGKIALLRKRVKNRQSIQRIFRQFRFKIGR